MSTPNDLEAYIDDLMTAKGLASLEPAVRDKLKQRLLERVERRINATILDNLPDDQRPAFDKLLDTGSAEQIQDFCQQQIPDLKGKLAKTLLDFRATWMQAAA